MDMSLYYEALKTAFLPYIKSIQDFHFYYSNPLFWAGFMVLYLILEIGLDWRISKAFFFCAINASVLLFATWFEKPIIEMFTIKGVPGGFDPFILRVATLTVVSIVTMYFILVDNF